MMMNVDARYLCLCLKATVVADIFLLYVPCFLKEDKASFYREHKFKDIDGNESRCCDESEVSLLYISVSIT